MEQHAHQKKVLLIVANPSISTTLGWPVGFWASELTHVYYECVHAGFEVTVASPQGGKVEMDSFSNPLNPDGYAVDDIITLGYLQKKEFVEMLENTPSVSALVSDDYDAIVVAGGQSPMFTFEREIRLQELFSQFYESGKVSATLCHGAALLLYTRMADGSPLIQGKTITGFTNEEEDYFDQGLGQKVNPFRIEDEATALGANFVKGDAFKPYAVRDGHLITGQQQHSGRKTAELVIQALQAD